MTIMTLLHQSRTTCLLCGASGLEHGYEAPVYAGAAFGWVTARNVLCRDCGFMFRNPMPETSSLREYYAGSSDASGSVFHADGEGSAHHSKQKQRAMFFLAKGSPRIGATILEIGCSSGEFFEFLPSSFRRFGIEPSPSSSARASERGVEVLAPFFEDLDSRHQFDVVAAFSVLEHVQDPIEFLSRARGAAHDESQLWLEVPNSLVPTVGASEYFGFEHLLHFTEDSLRLAMNRAGWRLEEVDETQEKRLRAIATASVEEPAPCPSSNYRRMRAMIRDYREDRKALMEAYARLSANVSEAVSAGGKVAVWGAGVHTRAVFSVDPDLWRSVSVVVDANPEKQGADFEGLEIRKPSELPELGITHCIISSQAFFEEISTSLQQICRGADAAVVALSPYRD